MQHPSPSSGLNHDLSPTDHLREIWSWTELSAITIKTPNGEMEYKKSAVHTSCGILENHFMQSSEATLCWFTILYVTHLCNSGPLTVACILKKIHTPLSYNLYDSSLPFVYTSTTTSGWQNGEGVI